ncbi:MAG: TldD/PmbA family protein, partial [Gemmatimonadaceae bacterium]|nr:TldD/PmbA family protein [Gemmatimonadaceae bacterium]
MPLNRRLFLKTGAAAAAMAAATTLPRPLLAQLDRTPEPVPPIDDPRLKALAARALDAARAAGASYADVRLTHTRTRSISPIGGPNSVFDQEDMEVGVRALVDGYWGFASGPVWSPDEMARLGREAVHQGKVNALGASRDVDLAPVPPVPDGHWVMPVQIDPFEVSPFEIQDFLQGLNLYASEHIPVPGKKGIQRNIATFVVQARAFASTDGSYCTQQLYRSSGVLSLMYQSSDGKRAERAMEPLRPAAMGWELYTAERIPQVRDGSLREELRRRVEEIREDLALPIKPVDVGRYDTVFDAEGVQNLLDETLGRATELDRALGYEANAGGTSYLTDPLGMLGSYQAGAPSLTVTANRSQPGGCATVKWDDEGVEPESFDLVKDGVLHDFQTTRESAGWIRASYARLGRPFRSHGCASAPSAVDPPMQHAPNLIMAPGREAEDFDSLVAGMSSGIAIKRASLSMDFQHSSGFGSGAIYEVKRGKRVARIASAGFLFRATELWKNLL